MWQTELIETIKHIQNLTVLQPIAYKILRFKTIIL